MGFYSFSAGEPLNYHTSTRFMNQYLLLRNNRQSGPYTASELASMGLKPFDLIWLEGKSAAWRYPGELEELKSFAPPVVEQPYDRFYKRKPSSPIPSNLNPVASASTKKSPGNSSHIYVAVPGSKNNNAVNRVVSQPEQQATHESTMKKDGSFREKQVTRGPEASATPSYSVRPFGEDRRVVEETYSRPFYETIPTSPVREKRSNKKPIMLMWAGLSFLFIAATAFFYFNYLEQKKQLKKLNELVLNMHQNLPPEPSPYNKTLVANFPIDVTEPFHDSLGKTEMTLVQGALSSKPRNIAVKKKVLLDSSAKEGLKKDSMVPVVASQEKIPDPKPILRNEITAHNIDQRLPITIHKYRTGFLGGISDLKISVANKSKMKIDRIKVLIEYLTPENKVVKTQSIDFENLSPGDSKTLEVPRTGRGSSVKCSIVSVRNEEDVITL